MWTCVRWVVQGGVENVQYATTIKERGGGGRKRTCDPQCKVCLNDGAMIVAIAHVCKPQCRLAHCHTIDYWRESGLFSRAKK